MKRILTATLLLSVAIACTKKTEDKVTQTAPVTQPDGIEIKAQPEADTLKGSPAAYATGKIGNSTLKIIYHSPAVRGRIIWGGLVPFDKVWVTGAHMATSVEFDQPLKVNNETIPAGKYALFTIPDPNTWTIILNKNWSQHLADNYDSKDDVIRVEVKPQTKEHQERLRYTVEQAGDSAGSIVIHWEKVWVALPIAVQ